MDKEIIIPRKVRDFVPGEERIDFDKTEINEAALEGMVNLTCPECDTPRAFTPVGIAFDKKGEVLLGRCVVCGQQVQSAIVNRPCFTWTFENGMREIMWDTGHLLQLVAKHKDQLPVIEVPMMVLDFYFEANGENAVDDPSYAMSRNLNEPIVSIVHPSVEVEVHKDVIPPLLPIDGWHRIYKAHQLRQTLKTYILPRELEMKVRVKDVVYAKQSPDQNNTRGDFESTG